MNATEMIHHAANAAYNDGLALAKLHDLSGAIISLSMALRYDKRHTQARNLLGLVYFEYGEPVLALREWVISKNYQPDDNRADYYLKEMQKGGTLEKLDSAAKKFNQGLEYAKSGNLDLAKIQLKRVLSSNPNMIRARQLLALIDMERGRYAEAKKELEIAAKADAGNENTKAYLQEVNEKLAESEKKKKKKSVDVIDIVDGNDVVRMPKQTFVEVMDNSKGGILNILLGTGLGVLVAIFLIVPTVKQKANDATASALINANAQAQTSKDDIEDLNEQIKKLKKKLDKYEGKADIKTSYELLIQARGALDTENPVDATEYMDQINKKLLSTEGKALYDSIEETVKIKQMEIDYAEAVEAMKDEDFETAIKKLKSVVGLDETYEEGDAMYRLAECYEETEKASAAIKYYRKVEEAYPGKYLGRKAKSRADALEASLEEQAEEASEDSTGDGTEGTAEDE